MNLRLVTDHHLDSGIGRYSFELSKALIQLDHQVALSKLYKKGADDVCFDEQYEWIRKIRYKSLRNLHSYLLPYFIGAHLLTARADVFHAHWFMAGLGLLKSGKKHRLITMHDVSLLHEKEGKNKFMAYYSKSIEHFAEKKIPIIVVSESARQDALTYSNLGPEQVFAVHNGVNFDQFFPLEKPQNNRFQLIYAGGLSPRKNLQLLLEACEILESRKVDFHLKIAGNHPNRTPYPKMAAEKKLKNVSFEGFISEELMNDFYNQADLFVYTSKYEGFGFAPLEAMATGTPVVSTPGGSLREVSGEGAELVEYDAEALAECIISFKEDEKKRQTQAAKGVEWVRQYTWQRCAEKTLEVYQRVTQ